MFDQETKLYYLQSRYNDSEIGRFINADSYISTGQGILGNNMFAYCGNSPVSGFDPSGNMYRTPHWQIDYLFFEGFGGIRTGGSSSSALVVDVSFSVQTTPLTYRKFGVSFVVDFEATEINMFFHVGGGFGISSGPSASIGIVSNYYEPEDYARDFIDVNIKAVDFCWNPYEDIFSATQAISISLPANPEFAIGYDFYFEPIKVVDWEE